MSTDKEIITILNLAIDYVKNGNRIEENTLILKELKEYYPSISEVNLSSFLKECIKEQSTAKGIHDCLEKKITTYKNDLAKEEKLLLKKTTEEKKVDLIRNIMKKDKSNKNDDSGYTK